MNLYLGDLVRPALGVYTIKALIGGESHWRPGVANLGVRPTVDGQDERLEAHLFDFDGDVYDKRVRVQFLRFIRPERKFESFDALGQYRETDNGKPVDTAGVYRFNDGEKAFADAPELMALIADSPQAHACYAKHLAEFALGREIDQADRAFIYELQERSRNGEASIQQALLSIVTSPAFTHRSQEAQ